MKNVIKPSEAVYLDEEVLIGSQESQRTSSTDDVVPDADYRFDREKEQVVDENLEQLDDDDAMLQSSAENVDTEVPPHTAANLNESPTENQLLSTQDNNLNHSLEFVRDDEQIAEQAPIADISLDSPEDNSNKIATSSDVDVTTSVHSTPSNHEGTINTSSQQESVPLSIDQHSHTDIPTSEPQSTVSSSSETQPDDSNNVRLGDDQPSVNSSLSAQLPTENALSALANKIESVHSALSSLQKTLSQRDADDSEWLAKLASIEQLLDTSPVAKSTGYDDGYKAGYQEAMEKGSDEIKNALHSIKKIGGQLLSRKKEIINESQDTIIDIILLIAQKVVKQISRDNKDIVVSNVKDALSKVKKHSNITIRINPADLATNEKILKTISHEMQNDSEIEFVEDATIDSGGVYIETESSSVNAQISAQLLEIENAIRDMR